MSTATIAALRVAVRDAATVTRYWDHVQRRGDTDCWYWLGALSGRGHGRFQIADAYSTQDGTRRRRQTFVVIAHRYGYALAHGVEALLTVPVVAHKCDNPLCQNPRHWHETNPSRNRREYIARRAEVLGPLADARGARGRARALRDALRDGVPLKTAQDAGATPLHRNQVALFDSPSRDYSLPTDSTQPAALDANPALERWDGVSNDDSGQDQLGLF